MIFKIFKVLKDGYFKYEIPQLAAAISYFAFLSIVPFFLLLMSLVGIAGSYLPLYGVDLKFYLSTVLGKYGDQVYLFASSIIEKRFSYGIVGLVALLITFSFSITPIEWALRKIFNEKKSSSFLKQRFFGIMIFVLIILILVIMAIFLIQLQIILTFLKRTKFIESFAQINLSYISISSYVVSFFFFITVVICSYLIYRWLTVKKPKRINCFYGALFTGVFVELGRQIYLTYLRFFPVYDIIYGAFSFFIVSIVFIYYATSVMLLGAVLIHYLEEKG